MRKIFLCLIASTLLVFIACKSESKSKPTEDDIESAIHESADGLKESANDLKENLEDQASKLKNLLKDGNNDVELVTLDDLKSLFPKSLDGLQRESLKGEGAGAFGFNIHTVKANYEKGDKKIIVEIIDFGGFSPALLGLAAWSATSIYKEDDNGFERVIDFKGHKAFEKSDYKNNESSIAVIYKKRIILNVTAKHLKLDDLKEIVEDDLLDELDDLKLKSK